MANIVGSDFAIRVRQALISSGLEQNPIVIVGRTFQFGAEFEDHYAIVVGTISGIEMSDLDSFIIRVSCPRFWGQEIDGLIYDPSKGVWMMRTVRHRRIVSETDKVIIPRHEFPGELQLL